MSQEQSVFDLCETTQLNASFPGEHKISKIQFFSISYYFSHHSSLTFCTNY